MSEMSKIQWTDATFNPWIGCTKVAPECDNCYAEAQDKFRSWTPDGWGAGKPRKLTKTWGEPVKWAKAAKESGVRRRVFCASLADVFDGEVEEVWRLRLFGLVWATPWLDWQILTKRPANAAAWFAAHPADRNVWLGTSVGSRGRLSQIDALRRADVPLRFLSVEPLIEDLGTIDLTGIHWVIVGGESGPKARPCNVEWIRSVVGQCKAAGVPVFVKQLGAVSTETLPYTQETVRVRLRSRKGDDMDEWPVDLRIREFPT
jgi:protein gp37